MQYACGIFPTVACPTLRHFSTLRHKRPDNSKNVTENRSPGRPGRRWEDNSKMDLQGVGCGSLDSIELA